MGLFPRNDRFFEQLNRFAGHIHEGAILFVEFYNEFPTRKDLADRIKEIERVCDGDSAAILEGLNTSFITPLDREDIYTLAVEMDDIMDLINKVAQLAVLYSVQSITPTATHLAGKILEVVKEVERATAALKNRHDMRDHIDRIRQIEEEVDTISQDAIHGLFTAPTEAVDLIRWLRIYEGMEKCVDRCKRVAKVLAGIVVKNA